ncbi:MAG TPA: O-antigen ligase family protein [Solirubrobacteraceae bacterium]|nr:O-antigen ligase family protein [Solirubrobacteraceae bacterium]
MSPELVLPAATTLPSAPVLLAATLGGLAAAALVLVLLRRRPEAFAPLVVLVLPFRLPISSGGRTVNLLIPLYVVVTAGTANLVLDALRSRREGRGAPAHDPVGVRAPHPSLRDPRSFLTPDGVQWLLLAAVALYALQTIYSADHAKGAENIAFFYVPFALLFVLLRRVRWTQQVLVACLAVAAALAVVFAGIGFVEYARKSLFLNPKVVAANQYDNYFRVNSLFFDPNIYGRFLALVMVAVSAALLWCTRRRDVLIASAVLAWLVAALVTSFSQSSIAALLLGLALLAAWRWNARAAAYVAVAVIVLGGALVLLAPASLHFGLKGSGGSTSNATSGRTKLISGGLELFAKRPIEGYGSGSFETEYKRHGHADSENATSASHTIPITVAAEQGILGLALYVALLVASFVVLFRGAGRSPPRMALAACFAALVLHTLTYADFLEDPFTWALLAIGVSLAAGGRHGWEAGADARDGGDAGASRRPGGASEPPEPEPAAPAVAK